METKKKSGVKILPISFGVLLAGKVHDGSKTMTRRVVKMAPRIDDSVDLSAPWISSDGKSLYFDVALKDGEKIMGRPLPVPYAVGDLLYVREPWRVNMFYNAPSGSDHIPDDVEELEYLADDLPFGADGRVRLARYLPARFARTFLRVTSVRCERLLDISEEDAVAEGVEISEYYSADGGPFYDAWENYRKKEGNVVRFIRNPRESFFSLWDSINGDGSAALNPWVWVIEFERVAMANPWNPSRPFELEWMPDGEDFVATYRDHLLGLTVSLKVEDAAFVWSWSYRITDENPPICGGSDTCEMAQSACLAAVRAKLHHRLLNPRKPSTELPA